MLRQVVIAGFVAVMIMSLGSGCCCMRMNGCGLGCGLGCNLCGDIGCDSCQTDCATGGCETGGCDTGGCDTGGCDTGGCDTGGCGATSCSPCEYYCWSPLHSLHNMLTCKSGCGELYYDNWFNNRPRHCDPCDNHGNWSGDSCCCKSCFAGLRNFLCGYRYDGCCEDCNSSHQPWREMPYGEVIKEEVRMEPTPQRAEPLKPMDAPPKPMLDESTSRTNGFGRARAVRYTASRTSR